MARTLGLSLFFAVGLTFASVVTAEAQTLTADYQFRNNNASAVAGAPALTNLGSNTFVQETVDGQSRTVLRFLQNNGLAVIPAEATIPDGARYTIVILFEFDIVSG